MHATEMHSLDPLEWVNYSVLDTKSHKAIFRQRVYTLLRLTVNYYIKQLGKESGSIALCFTSRKLDGTLSMEYFLKLLVLAFISNNGQAQSIPPEATRISEDDPCAAELGVTSPSDNLSCEFVVPGGTRCYFRSELCNGDLGVPGAQPFNRVCFTGSDEGANIAALDCKFIWKHATDMSCQIRVPMHIKCYCLLQKYRYWGSNRSWFSSLWMYYWRIHNTEPAVWW